MSIDHGSAAVPTPKAALPLWLAYLIVELASVVTLVAFDHALQRKFSPNAHRESSTAMVHACRRKE